MRRTSKMRRIGGRIENKSPNLSKNILGSELGYSVKKMDLTQILLLFGIGTIAGFLNSVAGGGSILTVPLLIFLGLDGATANGTNRVALVIQGISAVLSFRTSNMHEFHKSAKYTLFALPGAIVGALVAINIGDETFKRILGALMIIIVATLFIPITRGEQKTHIPEWMIYPALVTIGLYGGFLQIGVGFMIMAALYHIEKLDLVRVNMHKVFMILLYTIPALMVFAVSGNVNWPMGLTLAVGNAFGAWWGAKITVKGGEKIIRILLAVAVAVMSLKLFNVF